jgi:hypothetical protein
MENKRVFQIDIVFILDIVIVLFTVYGTYIMITHAGDGTGLMSSGFENLKYYTVLSNLFCGITAAMSCIRYIVKREEYNFLLLKFIAATVTGLTFLIIAAFLQPMYPDLNMYQNANLWFHLIIPITAMIQFLLINIERGFLPFKYTFITMIPSVLYGCGYLINILINGIGKWPDTNDWYGFI